MNYSKYIGEKLRFKKEYFYPKEIKELAGAIIVKTNNSKKVFTKKEFAEVLKNYMIDMKRYTDKQPQWRNPVSKIIKKKPVKKTKTIVKKGVDRIVCSFDENYIIYKDGRVYSKWFGGRFLKRWAMISVTGTKHWVVGMGNRKSYQLSRLIMFHFGNHSYKKMKDMPKIIFLDDNPSNLKLDNFKFADKGEILDKVRRLYPDRTNKAKIVDTSENIAFVINQLKAGKTLRVIAKHYNVSDMSVVRFKQRNLIK